MSQPFNYPCPHCGTPYALTPEYLAQYGGQATACTNCRGQFTIPTAPPQQGWAQPAAAPQQQPIGMPAGQAWQGGQAWQQGGAPGQPAQVLPYAGPSGGAAGPSGGAAGAAVWSDGRLVVAQKGASFAHACIKCGAPPEGRPFRRKFYWHQPILYLTILAGLLVYIIVALCVQESGTAEFTLCRAHRAKRRNGMLAGLGLALVGVGLFVVAAMQEDFMWVPFGILALFGGLIWVAIAARTLTPNKIDMHYLWLKGAGEPFLRTLPPAYPQQAYGFPVSYGAAAPAGAPAAAAGQ